MSPQVDFYILDSDQKSKRNFFICRLLSKAYYQGHQVYVLTDHEQEAQTLDDLLWTYHDTSFVPHARVGEIDDAPILISHHRAETNCSDILLNLSDDIPSFYDQFNRIIEVVFQEQNTKTISRKHYRFYQSQHIQLTSHEIKE